MAHLALYLLGPFQVALDGEPVRGLQSARLRALLACLAVERGEYPREALASLLWPKRPDREALTALRPRQPALCPGRSAGICPPVARQPDQCAAQPRRQLLAGRSRV
jgi:hypothetical protein